MAGSSFGTLFRVTTFGESHGPALGAIIDGCPPGVAITEEEIQVELDRRRPGTSRYTTQRREPDKVKILSGVFEGKTTGCSIGLLIENTDQKSKDYANIAETFRPAHADYTYTQKYGFRDYRGGGRSSARETAMRVAAGAIAKKFLAERYGVNIYGGVTQIGPIVAEQFAWDKVNDNPFFFPDESKVESLETLIHELRRDGSSIGAKVNVYADNVPAGWGDPVFDQLDADLAKAMMSINAVKAVAIGDGFDVVNQRGEEHRDEITPKGFLSNHAGGVLGGISSGQKLKVSMALKPTSSILLPGKSVNAKGEPIEVVTKGRHDPCVGVRATPIAEAMMALVLMEHCLRHRGQCGDVEPPLAPIPAGNDADY